MYPDLSIQEQHFNAIIFLVCEASAAKRVSPVFTSVTEGTTLALIVP